MARVVFLRRAAISVVSQPSFHKVMNSWSAGVMGVSLGCPGNLCYAGE
jgi:hypothetical protein